MFRPALLSETQPWRVLFCADTPTKSKNLFFFLFLFLNTLCKCNPPWCESLCSVRAFVFFNIYIHHFMDTHSLINTNYNSYQAKNFGWRVSSVNYSLHTQWNGCNAIFIFYFIFAPRILHGLLECYWSCNVLFICPSITCGLIPPNLLFLCVCFLHIATIPIWLLCVWPVAQQHIRDSFCRSFSTFCHACAIRSLRVNIGTNGRRACRLEPVARNTIYTVCGHCCDTL